MRILSITAQKPHSTGSGTYLTELVNNFGQMGHEQAVVCGIYEDDNVNFAHKVQVYPVYFCKKNDCTTNNSNTNSISFKIAGMSDAMPYPSTKYSEMDKSMLEEFEQVFLNTINKAIEEFNPELILCHHLFLLTAIVRKNYPNSKVYGICHGSDLRQFLTCEHLQDYICPEIIKLDKIFALHETQKTTITKIFDNAVANKVKVIGSGYNDELFNMNDVTRREANSPVRICFAGKMSDAKGVPELLDVLENINMDMKNKPSTSSSADGINSSKHFEALLAGGCQDEAIKSRIENLPSNIKYLGQLPQLELASLFKQSDIFILPSYYEGLGLVLIEAMACGMLPISTDIPGIKEWINDNVTNPNVKYIPMPEMEGIDVPSKAGRENFKIDMQEILMSAIDEVASGRACEASRPDTSRITWNAVCRSILEP